MNSSSHLRTLAQRWLAATCLLTASITALAQPAKALRFVLQADLKFLASIFTTNYFTHNFGYLVYNTLLGLDAQGVPRPQTVEKYSSSQDFRQWRFTLRPGNADLSAHQKSACRAAAPRALQSGVHCEVPRHRGR